jgi:hypothetical protein
MATSETSICLLSPREENNFRGARQFMHRWDFFKTHEAPSARGLMRTQVRESETGNINTAGTDRSSLSMIFLPWQDGFFDTIEPGVRDLVRFFVFQLDFITYTSCEGHWYRDRDMADERHVGILPRTEIEKVTALNGFTHVAGEWAKRGSHLPITIAVMHGTVRDDHAHLPTLDLYLARRKGASWHSYFSTLDAASRQLDEILGHCNEGGPLAGRENQTLNCSG